MQLSFTAHWLTVGAAGKARFRSSFTERPGQAGHSDKASEGSQDTNSIGR